MPNDYEIQVEYTARDGKRKKTFAVDGSHGARAADAKSPQHQKVDIVCTGAAYSGPTTQITFKLRP